MPVNKYSGFFLNQDQLYRKFYDAASVSADFLKRALSSMRDTQKALKIDYSDFSKHTYFNQAELKTTGALKKVIDGYPIGLSAQPTAPASLSAKNTSDVDYFVNTLNGFEKYVLNYLGGITGNPYTNTKASITALGTTESGDTIPLIVLGRNAQNGLTGQQAVLSGNLVSLAQTYDAGLNTIWMISGSAVDFDIVFYDDGSQYTSRVLPESRIESVNRQSDMTEWMPQSLYTDEGENTLEKFMSVVGSIFDDIKSYIDQLANLNHISYDDFDRVPDGVIQTILAKQFGYELIDTLLRQDISSYLRKVGGNERYLPLYEVAAKIFNRVLNNLIYIYKKKGTLEAIEALIRIYGLPPEYMQIDDFYFHYEPTIQYRVDYKNVRVLDVGGGSLVIFPASVSAQTSIPASTNFTIEARIAATASPTGAIIVSYGVPNLGYRLGLSDSQIWFSTSSTNFFAATDIALSSQWRSALSKGLWINIFGIRSGTNNNVYVTWIDESSGTALYNVLSGTISGAQTAEIKSDASLTFGASAGFISGWVGSIQEAKMFRFALGTDDILEHTQNFESLSWWNSGGTLAGIVGNWKLKENTVLSGLNYIVNAWSLSGGITGSGSGLVFSANKYKLSEQIRKETQFTNIGEFVDDNVDVYADEVTSPRKSNIIHIGFRPVNAVNADIINVYGDLNVSDVIGDPVNFYGSQSGYPYSYYTETVSAAPVFSRYSSALGGKMLGSKIALNEYINALEKLEPVVEGIMNGVRQLVPARSDLINRGVTIEQHLLESSRFHTNTSEFKVDASPSAAINVFDTSWSGSINETYTYHQQELLEDVTKYFSENTYRTIAGKNIQPFFQEVWNPNDTSIVLTFNRNWLNTDSGVTDWRASITGNIQLTRKSTGSVITSIPDCLRLDLPFASTGSPIEATELYFAMNVEGEALEDSKTSFEFPISDKKGINFLITRKSKFNDTKIGLLEIRITNLLSGAVDRLPILLSTDAAGFGGVIELITQIKV